MTPIEETPFPSPRNVPLWAGVVLILVIVGLIVWAQPVHG